MSVPLAITGPGLRVDLIESVGIAVPASADPELGEGSGSLVASDGGAESRIVRRDARREGEAGCLLVICFPVPERGLEPFDHWFLTEHMDMLLLDPDWLRATLVQPDTGDFTRVVVHALASTDPLTGTYRAAAGATKLSAETVTAEWWSKPVRYIFH